MKKIFIILKPLFFFGLLVFYGISAMAQLEVDLLPNQNPSGLLLVCKCGTTGKYVEYAETKDGNYFYLTTIGSSSIKAGFTEDISIKDIIYDSGYVYFCGSSSAGEGVLGRFLVNGLFGGTTRYEYTKLQCVTDPGMECCVTSVNKLASYIEQGERYVAFVGDMKIFGLENTPITTVGCATCHSGAWDVRFLYNKDAVEGYEDIAVTDNHVMSVGRQRGGRGYNAFIWKRLGIFLNHYASSREVSASVVDKPHICHVNQDTIAVAFCTRNQIFIDKVDITSGDYPIPLLGGKMFPGSSVQEFVYNKRLRTFVVQYSVDSLASIHQYSGVPSYKSACRNASLKDVDVSLTELLFAATIDGHGIKLCNTRTLTTYCHFWQDLNCVRFIHNRGECLHWQKVLHAPVEDDQFAPVLSNVIHELDCTE